MKLRKPTRGNAAFTEAEVRWIIVQRGKLSARDIAIMYGTGTETIRRIWRGDTWAHLPRPNLETDREQGEAIDRLLKIQDKAQEETAGLSFEERMERLRRDLDPQAAPGTIDLAKLREELTGAAPPPAYPAAGTEAKE